MSSFDDLEQIENSLASTELDQRGPEEEHQQESEMEEGDAPADGDQQETGVQEGDALGDCDQQEKVVQGNDRCGHYFCCGGDDENGEEDEEDWEDETLWMSRLEKFALRSNGKHYLMLSDWMEAPPPAADDLADQWYMVPVPEGKRTLIVAGGGRTSRYTRRGFHLGNVRTGLTGRGRKETVLDCIFVPSQGPGGTLYVLDVMVVNGHVLYDCDTQMRFEWGKEQLGYVKALQDQEAKKYPALKTLDHYPADPNSIAKVLSDEIQFCFQSGNDQENVPLDGLLFYHKDKQYAPGSTGLVSWLKGYMVPEMLDIPVGPKVSAQKPEGYSQMGSDIKRHREDHQRRKKIIRDKEEAERDENFNMQEHAEAQMLGKVWVKYNDGPWQLEDVPNEQVACKTPTNTPIKALGFEGKSLDHNLDLEESLDQNCNKSFLEDDCKDCNDAGTPKKVEDQAEELTPSIVS